jgi:hypothetical protein
VVYERHYLVFAADPELPVYMPETDTIELESVPAGEEIGTGIVGC